MRVFNIDISRKGISPVVQVTEHDAMSRFFTLVLRNGSSDYEPPENPTYSVWYKTRDSTGWYDTITLPDESTRPAVVVDGNEYTIEIAEQATTSCGELALMINGDDGYQLTVSGIITRSDDIPGYDGEEVENYYNVYITEMRENAARAENAAATAIEYGATVEVDETAQQLIITHTDNTGDVETFVTEAEAWAVGQRDGIDVPSTDETYHNNAKYYAEQAAETISADMALNNISTHPVQNQVIAQAINTMSGTVGKASGETVTPTATNNYGISGTVGQQIETLASTDYWHGVYAVTADDTYAIKTVSDLPQQIVVWFTDSSNVILENRKAFATDSVDMVCIAPTGATKLYVMSYGSESYLGSVQKIKPVIDQITRGIVAGVIGSVLVIGSV